MQLQLFPTTVYLMSGGVSSTLATYYHQTHVKPLGGKVFYFNDTLIEDPDTYRFLIDSVYFLLGKKIGITLAKLVKNIPVLRPGVTLEKRVKHLDKMFDVVCRQTGLVRECSVDPWQSFLDNGYIGNTRVDICSSRLKREPRKKYTDLIPYKRICLGFGVGEIDRYKKAQSYEPELFAPLADDFIDTDALWDEFSQLSGIQKSKSYALGFPHDNCGGMCVKAGLGQFELLYKTRRDVYLWHENRMEWVMDQNPNLKPFLRKTVNKETRYLTLKVYREEYLEKGVFSDELPSGGCGCAI